MSDIYSFKYSLVAELSYIDFSDRIYGDDDDLYDALTDNQLSSTLAKHVVDNWSLISYQPNTLTGFSATLFKNRLSGEFALAIRGTENGTSVFSPLDWLTNISDIGSQGIAVNQAVDLYNYIIKLSAKAGQLLRIYKYSPPVTSNKEGIQLIPPSITFVDGGVAVEDGPLADKHFTVTGHSLGGHLAMVASRLFPEAVDGVYTFVAPGFDTELGRAQVPLGSEGFFDLMRRSAGTPIGDEWDVGLMHHLVVRGDIVSTIGVVPGLQTEVASEGESDSLIDAVKAHDKRKITDALAVASLFSRLDNSATLGDVSTISRMATAVRVNRLEATLARLASLFGRDLPETDNGREQFYADFRALMDAPEFQAAEGRMELKLLVGQDSSTLAMRAGADPSYSYALSRLNPFALEGYPVVYDRHNRNRRLEPYDPMSRTGMTDRHLKDRAAFLTATMTSNWTGRSAEGEEAIEFYDTANDRTLSVETAFPDSSVHRKIQFGTDQSADHLTGGSGNDSVFGGGGDDVLSGNGGNDYLEGGEGSDRYIYRSGGGLDTIFDSDGNGRIEFDGLLLTGGERIGSGIWLNREHGHVFALEGDLNVGGSLLIDGALRVESYRNGDLGIRLETSYVEIPPADYRLEAGSSYEMNAYATNDSVWLGDLVGLQEVDRQKRLFVAPIQVIGDDSSNFLGAA